MSKEAVLKNAGRKLHLEILNAEEISILHDAVCSLLWETGVMVECPKAAERFQGAGAKVVKKSDGYLVRLPQWLIMDSIAFAPANMPWYGQSPELDFFPASGEPSLLTFGVHVKIIDPETRELRATTKNDCDNLARALNFFPNIKMQLDSLAATDYPGEAMTVAQAHAMLSNNARFAFSSAATDAGNEVILKMAHAVAGGEDKFRDRPFLCITASPISPLLLKKECTNTLAFTAQAGMVSQAVNMCLAGATGPVTLAGAVVLSVAELLFALTYVQIVKKGAPSILSTCSSIMDMHSGLAGSGSPDTAVICGMSARMLASYGLYGIFNSGVSDSKIPDAQSAYEFAVNAALIASTRASVVFGAGSLEGGLTFDYAKMILDNECFTNIMKFLNGISFDRDSLALDLMKEIGPGHSYLQHRNTFKQFKSSLSQNDLFSRASREAWTNAGSVSVTEKAYERSLELLKKEQPPHLSETVKAEIDGLLAGHLAKVKK